MTRKTLSCYQQLGPARLRMVWGQVEVEGEREERTRPHILHMSHSCTRRNNYCLNSADKANGCGFEKKKNESWPTQ